MDPVHLVVARARIAGGVLLEREAPEELRLAAGQELLVKLAYRFDELSRDREDYIVTLRTRLDDEPHVEERFEGRDRATLDDARRGLLLRRHMVLASGTHVLDFHARVSLAQSRWDATQADTEEAEIEGQVRIVAA